MEFGATPSTALIVTGGVSHDFGDSSAALAEALAKAGFACTITDDPDAAFARLDADNPLLVLNLLRWSMAEPRFAAERERRYTISAAGRTAIEAHLARGGGILAMHTASICFDDWDGWPALLGARWNWARSSHGPVGAVAVRMAGEHPITAGLSDFTVEDEVYIDLDLAGDLAPLAFATAGDGRAHPILWTRAPLGGRLVHDVLGHDRRSLDHPVHRDLIGRAARWACGIL